MTEPTVDSQEKRYYILKTNGIANIRTINLALNTAPERPNFWMPGFLVPRKFRRTTVLRKEFLFYDYTFVEVQNPHEFERFLLDRAIPAYFLHWPGTKIPAALSQEEILRVKNLEAFKQLEVDQLKKTRLRVGSFIEVVNGPFIGCKGTVLEVTATHAVLEMNVFGRPTRVSISVDFLENMLQDYDEEYNPPVDDE